MGYVYTANEIILGMVPDDDSFPLALEQLKGRLGDLHGDGKLYGALIQGSSANGTYSPGSDIDVMVAANPEYFWEVGEELEQVRQDIFSSTYVPVEAKPFFNVEHARRGVHRIPRNFMSHLFHYARDAGNIIGNNPLTEIRQKPLKHAYDEEQEAVSRMSDQLSRLSEDPVSRDPNDPEYCKYLERLMRRPIWAAYNMLALLHPLPESRLDSCEPAHSVPLTPEGDIPSKEEISEMYVEEFPEVGVEEHLSEIMAIRKRYRDYLREIGGIGEDRDDYPGLLHEIESYKVHAAEFIARNVAYLLERSHI